MLKDDRASIASLNLVVDPPRRAPLGDAILENLKDAIVGFRLKPGDRLVESVVAAQFDVSATPVREALQKLVYLGFVDRSLSKGVVVHRPAADEVADYFEMRATLEPAALRQTAERAPPDHVKNLTLLISKGRTLVRRGQFRDALLAGGDFNGALIGHVTNRLLKDALDGLASKRLWYSHFFRPDNYDPSIDWSERSKIVALLASRKVDAAARAHCRHIQRVARVAIPMFGTQKTGLDQGRKL